MKLITGTGKEFQYTWVGTAFTGNLVISIENANVQDVILAGTNPEDTGRLTFYPDNNKQSITIVETGYTRFIGVLIDARTGNINLTLGKEFA